MFLSGAGKPVAKDAESSSFSQVSTHADIGWMKNTVVSAH